MIGALSRNFGTISKIKAFPYRTKSFITWDVSAQAVMLSLLPAVLLRLTDCLC